MKALKMREKSDPGGPGQGEEGEDQALAAGLEEQPPLALARDQRDVPAVGRARGLVGAIVVGDAINGGDAEDGEHVDDDFHPEHLLGQEDLDAAQGSEEAGEGSDDVEVGAVLEVRVQVLVEPPPPVQDGGDGTEAVVEADQIRLLPHHLIPLVSHGNAHVRLLLHPHVFQVLARRPHHLPVLLEALHQLRLLLRVGSRQDADRRSDRQPLLVRQPPPLCCRHHTALLQQGASLCRQADQPRVEVDDPFIPLLLILRVLKLQLLLLLLVPHNGLHGKRLRTGNLPVRERDTIDRHAVQRKQDAPEHRPLLVVEKFLAPVRKQDALRSPRRVKPPGPSPLPPQQHASFPREGAEGPNAHDASPALLANGMAVAAKLLQRQLHARVDGAGGGAGAPADLGQRL
eukprot:768014-Hanusia_phi.AAC.1